LHIRPPGEGRTSDKEDCMAGRKANAVVLFKSLDIFPKWQQTILCRKKIDKQEEEQTEFYFLKHTNQIVLWVKKWGILISKIIYEFLTPL